MLSRGDFHEYDVGRQGEIPAFAGMTGGGAGHGVMGAGTASDAGWGDSRLRGNDVCGCGNDVGGGAGYDVMGGGVCYPVQCHAA